MFPRTRSRTPSFFWWDPDVLMHSMKSSNSLMMSSYYQILLCFSVALIWFMLYSLQIHYILRCGNGILFRWMQISYSLNEPSSKKKKHLPKNVFLFSFFDINSAVEEEKWKTKCHVNMLRLTTAKCVNALRNYSSWDYYHYGKIWVRNTRRRWKACSSDNN